MAAIEFALVAPMLLMLVFGIIIYGFYFATGIAVAHAAAEGARASVAGMTQAERQSLAESGARAVFADYAPLLDDDAAHLQISTGPSATPGMFAVTVSYDLSDRNFASFAGLLPLPSSRPAVTVTVANGGY